MNKGHQPLENGKTSLLSITNSLVLFVVFLMLGLPVIADESADNNNQNLGAKLTADNSALQVSKYEMILIGGALHTCSSMSERRCINPQFEAAKNTTRYSINTASMDRLVNFIENNSHDYSIDNLLSVVGVLKKSTEKSALTRRELFTRFESLGVYSDVDALSDFAYYALLDFLEDAEVVDGQRLKEVVRPNESRNPASIGIWNQISKQALAINKDIEKTIALAVTASARDIFEAVDFYVGGLSAIGLDSEWLPISAALVEAISARETDDNACQNLEYYRQKYYQFDRERVYPDLHKIQVRYCENPDLISDKIKQSSAIFFNGGDQSKTLAAFMQKGGGGTDYLYTLREQVKQKQLLVVGTSAGTAVQSGGVFNSFPTVMISNGTSANAMRRGAFGIDAPSQRCTADNCQNGIQGDDLTYRTLGGLATFQLGVLDTHFSERNREARLIALTQATRNSFGFGVDETTALMVSQKDNDNYAFEVVGSQGVFIVDNVLFENALYKKLDSSGATYAGSVHFFPTGTKAQLNTVSKEWKVDFSNIQSTEPDADGVWRHNAAALCKSPGKQQLKFEYENYQAILAKDKKTRTYDANESCGFLFMNYAVASK